MYSRYAAAARLLHYMHTTQIAELGARELRMREAERSKEQRKIEVNARTRTHAVGAAADVRA